MDLRNLIEFHLDLEHLSKDLDELGPPGRAWAVRQWTRADAKTLWRATAGFRPLTADDLVPSPADPGGEVVYEGYRPGARIGGHFKMHLRRVTPNGGPDAGTRVLSYEEHGVPVFAGPSHALVVSCAAGGEVALDHGASLDPLPAGWPAVRPPSRLLGAGAGPDRVEVLRALSSHVVVGRTGRRVRSVPAARARASGDGPRPSIRPPEPHSIPPFHRGEVVQWLDLWTVLVRQESRPRS